MCGMSWDVWHAESHTDALPTEMCRRFRQIVPEKAGEDYLTSGKLRYNIRLTSVAEILG